MKLFCVYMQMQLMKLYEKSSSLYERVGNYVSQQSRERASRLFVHLTVLKELPRVLFVAWKIKVCVRAFSEVLI